MGFSKALFFTTFLVMGIGFVNAQQTTTVTEESYNGTVICKIRNKASHPVYNSTLLLSMNNTYLKGYFCTNESLSEQPLFRISSTNITHYFGTVLGNFTYGCHRSPREGRGNVLHNLQDSVKPRDSILNCRRAHIPQTSRPKRNANANSNELPAAFGAIANVIDSPDIGAQVRIARNINDDEIKADDKVQVGDKIKAGCKNETVDNIEAEDKVVIGDKTKTMDNIVAESKIEIVDKIETMDNIKARDKIKTGDMIEAMANMCIGEKYSAVSSPSGPELMTLMITILVLILAVTHMTFSIKFQLTLVREIRRLNGKDQSMGKFDGMDAEMTKY